MRRHVQPTPALLDRRRNSRALLVPALLVLGAIVACRWRLVRRRVRASQTGDEPLDGDSRVASQPLAVDEPARAVPERGLRRHVRLAIAGSLLIVLIISAGSVAEHVGRAPHLTPAEAASAPPSTLAPAPLEVVDTSPAPGTTDLGLSNEIAVQFSAPLAAGTTDPMLVPSTPGTWTLERSTTLVFRPNGYFTPLSKLSLTVAAGAAGPHGRLGQSLAAPYTASFSVPAPSVLRLQQLLADLDYLPLRFDAAAPAAGLGPASSAVSSGATTSRASAPSSDSAPVTISPTTGTSAIEAGPTAAGAVALSAQPGTFSWRYPKIPVSLSSLWQPGVDTVLVQGAVMAFESDHGLKDDGELTAAFWADLLSAVASGQVATGAYDYLEVSTALPETLSVWQDGTVVFQSPTNTGIPQAPTALGTFPVYARFLSTTMSGYNPDGSYYDDPGVPYVAYFNGGDAVHGFYRYAYGFPQSLGCVELPYSAAAVVFNDDPIGTLVYVS